MFPNRMNCLLTLSLHCYELHFIDVSSERIETICVQPETAYKRFLPSWFLQIYINFSADANFVAAHLLTYGSIFPPATIQKRIKRNMIS